MKGPRLADDLPVDLPRLIVTRMLIQASSGAGKSWALRRLLEQTHGAVQHLVIDPEGEFFTLRERFDYVLAARHGGDTSAEPRIAGLLAERLLEIGASAILDLYDLPLDQRKAFVKAFLEAVIDAPRKLWHPALVVVDEAHVFCPEKGMGESESAAAVKDLCTRGRKRGFAPVLATQRLAKLAKDAAAECTNKLIGRTNLDLDVKRAADELGFGRDRWPELKGLGDGDFFAFGPALTNEVRRHHIGPVLTTHPKVGTQLAAAPPPPTDAIKALLPKLSDLPAEQERKVKTEADLRTEIRSLKGQLAARPATPAPKVEMREVQVLDEKLVARLESLAGDLGTMLRAREEEFQRGEKAILAEAGAIRAALQAHRRTAAAPPMSRASMLRTLKTAPINAAPRPRREVVARSETNGNLSGPEQKILDALCEMRHLGIEPASRPQLGAWCGYTNARSGGFTEPLGRLADVGMVDFPAPGKVSLTNDGYAHATPPDIETTTEALHERVIGKLDGPQARLLQVVLDAYPAPIDRVDLAAKLNYQNPRSGGFTEPLGHLRTLGLVAFPRPGQVLAAAFLFLED